jgi:hypothetical protein
MNQILKKSIWLLVLFLGILTNTTWTSDWDMDALIESPSDEQLNVNRTSSVTNVDVLDFFITTVKLNNIAADNLYLRTNLINSRELNSLPIFNLSHSNLVNENWLCQVDFFANQTLKHCFVDNQKNINSYLKLDTNDLIEKIDQQISDVQIPPILELFHAAKLQERRIGIMFQLFKNHGKWSFSTTIPLTYQERNFFFSESEQAKIEQELSAITGSTSSSVDRDYLYKHAVADQVGLGNLKLKLGYLIENQTNFKFKFGPTLELPTAATFRKGLLGSNFKDYYPTPTLDLHTIYTWLNDPSDPATQAAFKQFGTNFLELASKRLGALVLANDLGNWRHFEIGCFFDSKLEINYNTSILGSADISYAIPHHEYRFFNQIKNPSDFTYAALTATDEATASQNLNFLNQNLVTTLFPNIALAQVHPGLTTQFSVGPLFEAGGYQLQIGYNFWHRMAERIKTAQTPQVTTYPLDLNLATTGRATQHSLFTRFNYRRVTPKHIWTTTLSGSSVINNSGIGKDATITVGLSVDF